MWRYAKYRNIYNKLKQIAKTYANHLNAFKNESNKHGIYYKKNNMIGKNQRQIWDFFTFQI